MQKFAGVPGGVEGQREKVNDYIMTKGDPTPITALDAAMTLEMDAPLYVHSSSVFSAIRNQSPSRTTLDVHSHKRTQLHIVRICSPVPGYRLSR